MSTLQDYIDETISWSLDAALVLQQRAQREAELARLWREEGCDQLAAVAQNEAMGMYAHARIAYAQLIHHRPNPFDVTLTTRCWARAQPFGGI